MNDRSIGSHPGAGIFRSTLIIIIIIICILLFFAATDHLSEKAERVAAERVVTDMRQALSMMLYDYAIKGQLADLQKFDRENPFVPLAIYRSLPRIYHGVVSDLNIISVPGWYFDRSEKFAIYHFNNKDQADLKFSMVFIFEDLDGDQVYSKGDIGYLKIEKAWSEEANQAS